MKLVVLNKQRSCVLGLDSRMFRESLVPFPDEAAICFVLPKLSLTAGTYIAEWENPSSSLADPGKSGGSYHVENA